LAHSLLFPFGKRHPSSRTSTSASVTLAAVVLAGAGACYTGPINMPPVVGEIVAVDPLKRGSEIRFRLPVSDPDNDAVKVTWSHSQLGCRQPGTPEQELTRDVPYSVPGVATQDKFCVWATARDRYGATTAATPVEVNPNNSSPDVVLNAALELPEERFPPPTFPLYRSIKLDASRSSDADDDQLTFQWDLIGGPDLMVTFLDCADGASSSVRCLTPRQPGTYRVKVTVKDGHDGVTDVTEALVVNPDQLPCIGNTEPAATMVFNRPDVARKIRVDTVTDDGDPWPAIVDDEVAAPTFRWFVGPKDGDLQMLTADGVYYEIPAFSYNVGDEIRVRVEVLDRNKQKIMDRFVGCKEMDTCGTEDGCLQRMTWLITYSE
jgi:hypothetical protein